MMRKRFLLFALLLFALVFAPSLSLADDGFGGSVGGSFDGDYGVKYTTVTHDGDWTGFLVKAADSWSAAVYACGGDPARISADVRSRLSDPNYGGAFYMYATNYAHIMSVYEIPEFVPLYVLAGLGISSVWQGEFGDMMLWYADTPNSLLESAMIDFRRVLAGDDLSGGTTTYPPGQYYKIDIVDNINPFSSNAKFRTFYFHVDSYNALKSYYGSKKAYFLYTDSKNQNSPTWGVWFSDSITVSNGRLAFSSAYRPSSGFASTNINGSVLLYWKNSSFTSAALPPSVKTNFYPIFSLFEIDVSTLPVVTLPFADGEWPEPTAPVTPDPPEVPTPTAPTVTPDPEPTAPSITWPTSPTLVLPSAPVVETTPEGNDYTSLLMLINDNLNSIDSYLQTFYSSFNGFRSDFLAGVDAIVGSLRNIYQYLGHLSDILEVHCKHIRDSIDDNFYELELYLKGLFEWLPEQLKFDSVYDDSAVVDWLSQIYYKLGGGTYAPNPVADPGGFFDWLGGLVAGFLASLLAGLPGKIQELLSDIGDLTGYFPFSAPWDLYALLALFSHDPVIPVFTIPWGMGGGHTASVVVDCSQWDGVMSIVRSVEKIIFAGGLAKLTFDMFKPTDVTGD